QPEPKRRALAMADNKPALTAVDVSKQFTSHVREGAYGAPPAEDLVGFDEMLPDLPSRTVLPHERADLTANPGRHPWIEPYLIPSERVHADVYALLERAHQGERLDVG